MSRAKFEELCGDLFKRTLKPDPGSADLHPNKEPREVFGQWVEVSPTPLPEPYLVSFSPDMCREIGLDPAETSTEAFVKLVSGVDGPVRRLRHRRRLRSLPSLVRFEPEPAPKTSTSFDHGVQRTMRTICITSLISAGGCCGERYSE